MLASLLFPLTPQWFPQFFILESPLLEVVFTSDGSRNKGIDVRISNANAVLLELYSSDAFKDCKAFSFKSFFCSDPHRWSSISDDDWNNTVNKADGRDGIFAKSPPCETSWQGAQVWNPWGPECQATFPNRENLAMFVRPRVSRMFQERMVKYVIRATVYNYGKRARSRSRTKWRNYISNLAWSRFGLEAGEQSESAVDRELFRVLLGPLSPRFSPNEKRAQNWVTQWLCRPTLKLSIYVIVFRLFDKSECCFQIIKHMCTETGVSVKMS